MAGNVLASWAGQSIFVIAGFIMPHMIDRRLGQNLLGVWDFSWSLVSYFSLVQVGIVGSVSRYVALHRGKSDAEGMNCAVSSVTCLLLVMASAVVLLTLGTVHLLGRLRGDALGAHLQEARWVVLLLGTEIAAQTVFSVFAGVITGCHRWGIHNGITACSYFFTVLGMIAALLLGGGLRGLALIHLLGELAAGVARCIAARHVCPSLRMRFASATGDTMMSMLRYGLKSWVPSIGDLVLNQTTSVLIAASLGPAALAVYSRSRSLVRYSRDLVMKMAGVLVASVSSLHAAGDRKEIQDLVIKATRYSAFLALPMAMLLIISGGSILRIWMGSRYVGIWIVATLAVGQTAAVLQLPGLAVLAGMNRHGRLAMANLAGSVISVAAVVLALKWMKLGLLAVAVAGTVPLLLINTIYAPIHTCRCVGLSTPTYFRQTALYALVRTLPFAVCLLAARWLLGSHIKLALLVGMAAGGAVLVPIYWRNVVPGTVKAAVLRRIRWPGKSAKVPIGCASTNAPVP